MQMKSLVFAAVSFRLATAISCESLKSSLSFTGLDASVISSTSYSAYESFDIVGGQSVCASSATPEIDICRLVMSVKTGVYSDTYIEVWMPSSGWNGRIMATDNEGLGGCVAYDDMAYVNSMGFAVVGDNAAHNNTAFDGSGFLDNNDVVVDFSYRSKHAAIVSAKQVVNEFYGSPATYSYFIGCSTGGRIGLKSAQVYPDDFDGIIAGASASDFNHLSDWSGRFRLIIGFGTDDRSITLDQWTWISSEVLSQCDEPLDGVADGIIEDPTICAFNATKLLCGETSNENCLTATQVTTVENVYSELYDQEGNLLYPSLSLGAELVAAQQGMLTGTVEGTSADWFRYGVYNNTPTWNPDTLSQTDYSAADDQDVLHGNISSFSGDLSGFSRAGGKLLMHHGMSDPNIAFKSSQRYYLHVAQTMGLGHTALDSFFRFFRISGANHCTASGPGAWMFGQTRSARNATENVVDTLVQWVENGVAPDTLTGTKFVNDDVNQGVAFERSHCRFPYRTTWDGKGDPNEKESWGCEFIEHWRQCGPGALPRLC